MTKTNALIVEMVADFISETRKQEWLRDPAVDIHAHILLQTNGNGWRLLAADDSDYKNFDYELAIPFPNDLPDDDFEQAMVELAVILAIRLSRFFTARAANASRSPEKRRENAKKAIAARWAKKDKVS